MTRTTRGSMAAANEAHVLDFNLDNDNDECSLTVLVKEFRFHITADGADLLRETSVGSSAPGESGAAVEVRNRFQDLIRALRAEKEEEDYQVDGRAEKKAKTTTKGSKQAKAEKTNTGQDHTTISETDSGADLRDWMLAPFSRIFDGLEPVPEVGNDGAERQTLQEWYSGPTYFYKLTIGPDGELAVHQLEDSAKLEEKIKKLVPRISLPKATQKLDIPWYHASEIEVVKIRRNSDTASHEGKGDSRTKPETVYFFKRVDPTQVAPTKRELEMMKDIEAKDLHHKINVPLVHGLVRWYGNDGSTGNSLRNQIMGFLQTAVEDPTPLTRMLDSDVIEDKRQAWAKQVEQTVKVLHDAGVVWGDAKADNFMVDRYGKLWIIDFGGSYTEGWIDPDLEDTQEGDDMGVDKIVGALKDPENMTYDPDADIGSASGAQKGDDEDQGNKRKREELDEDDNARSKNSHKKARE
ncbi:hypothetical protein Micbo1qcDRAFT_149429 [Microdochium bolleyi]|uniref:Protein kinase domain-containing protein n=1 Tax=Microdochium bolleyi TaxID=196109 RepID=A0A136IXU6_9PEZI|nr:hypothetical protein Micbo1qcDRAFT_149429 [Microdochium bolleyi]